MKKERKNSYKKIILFIILPVFLVLIYIFSAMYSFHQVHKAFYYNNKHLSKNYIEWDEVKNNFKDYFNVNLLKEMANEEEFKELGEFGVLITGLTGKFVDYAIDTYISPEGLSLFLEKSEKKSDIPKPNFATLIGGISIMEFDSLNSFHVDIENEEKKIPIHFYRFGTKWKVIEIEFPKDIFKQMDSK
jgi:cell division protein FtsL|tara:strand:+ start:120 stop:683 length:564 start_codon:yes stop_codon:yes gene_type:complete